MADDPAVRAAGAVGFLPLDEEAGRALEPLVAGVSRRVRVPCRVVHGAAVPRGRRIDGRDQVDADALLEQVEALAGEVADEDEVLVAVTSRDIGSALFTHFFGRARQWGPAALVSLARLDPGFYGLPADPALARRRAEVEVLHELGHLMGLGHCRMPGCVMKFAASVDAIDRRGGGYCGACTAALPAGLAVPAR